MHLQALHDRVDWLLAGLQGPDYVAARGLISLAERIDDFRVLMKSWLERCPDPLRMAWGLDAVRTVSTLADARELASQYVGFVVDEGIVSDFSYQANRFRQSTVVASKQLNRFARWSILESVRQTFRLTNEGLTVLSEASGEKNYLVRGEFDINTIATAATVCSRQRLPDVLNELIEIAEDVLVAGDAK